MQYPNPTAAVESGVSLQQRHTGSELGGPPVHRPRRTLAIFSAAAMTVTGFAVAGGARAGAATAPNGLIAYSAWDAELNYDIYTIDPANPDAPPVQLTTDGRYN